MPSSDPLVSIGLPIHNGEQTVPAVVRSILGQSHGNLELVISDNASTDGTEDVCRELARDDSRIAYHRQRRNIGLLNNFNATTRLANGAFFRWVSDDDSLEPDFVSRCLEVFAGDDRLILVTTQTAFVGPDGATETAAYRGTALRSSDPVDRFLEMLRLLNQSHLLLDPVYGLWRRDAIAAISRRNMLREDEVFAAKMALAGPWGHVPEVLARRHWKHYRLPSLARRLGVPAWHARVATVLQCRELLRCVRDADLSSKQRRRARNAIAALFLRRHQRTVVRRSRKIVSIVAALVTPRRASND